MKKIVVLCTADKCLWFSLYLLFAAPALIMICVGEIAYRPTLMHELNQYSKVSCMITNISVATRICSFRDCYDCNDCQQPWCSDFENNLSHVILPNQPCCGHHCTYDDDGMGGTEDNGRQSCWLKYGTCWNAFLVLNTFQYGVWHWKHECGWESQDCLLYRIGQMHTCWIFQNTTLIGIDGDDIFPSDDRINQMLIASVILFVLSAIPLFFLINECIRTKDFVKLEE